MAASQTPEGARRVMIVGSPGAGKSTLARELAAARGLPLVHLDQLGWTAGWVEVSREAFETALDTAMAGEAWIIDGNYTASISRRLARAETVIWLDPPTRVCLWRIVRRVMLEYGQVRADMAPGCPERLNAEFLLYVATFRRRVRPKVAARLEGFAGPIVRLTSSAEVAAFRRVWGVADAGRRTGRSARTGC